MTRVTVLTTVYNEERYVAKAIDSILAQTFTDFEFLIVDDGSADRSAEIITSYRDARIRFVRNERNLGLPGALNRGLREAKGELIAVFDANDISHRERLAHQVAFLDAHPEVAAVSSQMNWIGTHGRRLRHPEIARPVTADGIDWYSIFDAPLVHSAVMYRTSVVRDELGGYDETWVVGQDADLWRRIRARHQLANLPEVLLDCRIDPSSTSGNQERLFELGHGERWRALTLDNLRRHLRLDDVPEAWAATWVRIHQPDADLTAAELVAFCDVLETVRRRFIEVHPGAERNREVSRQAAILTSRLILPLAALDSFAALRRYAALFARHFGYAVRIFPRFVTLLVFGEKAHDLWRRVRRVL